MDDDEVDRGVARANLLLGACFDQHRYGDRLRWEILAGETIVMNTVREGHMEFRTRGRTVAYLGEVPIAEVFATEETEGGEVQ